MGSKVADLLFHIINIFISVCVIASGVLLIYVATALESYSNKQAASSIIIGVYIIAFGVFIFVWELKHIKFLRKGFGFMKWWAGRGLFYIFLGLLTIGVWVNSYFYYGIPTIIEIVVGIIYCVLQFIKGLDQPGPILGGESTSH